MAATTPNPQANSRTPTPNQGSDDDQQARDTGTGPETPSHEKRAFTTTRLHETVPEIDWERLRYWQAVCADLPPMTEQEIANVALIMRRIDAQRAQHGADPPR